MTTVHLDVLSKTIPDCLQHFVFHECWPPFEFLLIEHNLIVYPELAFEHCHFFFNKLKFETKVLVWGELGAIDLQLEAIFFITILRLDYPAQDEFLFFHVERVGHLCELGQSHAIPLFDYLSVSLNRRT